jgi:hypothetical protein
MIEWIPHNGDECPVKPGTLVEVSYGSVQDTTIAERVDWASAIRYRVRMPAPDGVAGTIAERENTHGSFELRSEIARRLRDAMSLHERDNGFTAPQEDALIHICNKLSRIAAGDSCCSDHWHDIAGYATLAAQTGHDSTQKGHA